MAAYPTRWLPVWTDIWMETCQWDLVGELLIVDSCPPEPRGSSALFGAVLGLGRAVGGFLKAQPLDVDRECGQDVLDVRLHKAAVAALASTVAVHELLDAALSPPEPGRSP